MGADLKFSIGIGLALFQPLEMQPLEMQGLGCKNEPRLQSCGADRQVGNKAACTGCWESKRELESLKAPYQAAVSQVGRHL